MLPERILYRFRDLVKHNWRGITSEDDAMNLVCTYRIVVQVYLKDGSFFYIPELENAIEKHIPDMILTALDPGHIKNVDLTEFRNVYQKDASNIQVKECFCPTAAVPEDTMLRWLLAGSKEFSCRILDTGKVYSDEPQRFIFKIDPCKSLEPQEIVISIDDLMISREEIVKLERDLPEDKKEQQIDIDEKIEPCATVTGGRPLEGWKAIAAHADCCISTAKNRYKKIIRRSESGRPFIMSAELDAYRDKNSTKERPRKKA